MSLLDTDGTVLETNQTALLFGGLTEEKVIGKPLWEASWWAYSTVVQDLLKDAIARAAEGEFIRYPEQVMGSDNALVTIDFSIKPILDPDGRVYQLISEGRDITSELETSERQLQLTLQREMNELIRQFVQDASHHLRTPLTIMTTTLFLVEKTAETALDASGDDN